MSQRVGEQVPAPVPPDDPDAWYAPDVCDQREIHPGVVATIRERPDGFAYDDPNREHGNRPPWLVRAA